MRTALCFFILALLFALPARAEDPPMRVSGPVPPPVLEKLFSHADNQGLWLTLNGRKVLWQPDALSLSVPVAKPKKISKSGLILQELRYRLGADTTEIIKHGSGLTGKSLSVGRFVHENVLIGVEHGLKLDSGKANMNVDVTPNIRIESQAGTDLRNEINLRMQWEW
ncbi:MAG: hypothetical protein U9N14_06800 [Pseudomonadota bacterium]|nr:hypothetical protein [Pseudomonadota bacterium]